MIETSLQERLLTNINTMELTTRICMGLFFGLSVFGFGWVLHCQSKKGESSKVISKLSYLCFVLGSLSLMGFTTVELILPMTSYISQIYIFSCFLFAIFAIIYNQNKEEFPAICFILGSLIFLFTSLISILEPKVLYPIARNTTISNLHISLSILSQIVFVVSLVSSFLFIITHRKLKKKYFIHPISLSLSTLERIMDYSSFIGLGFITLALVSGILLSLTGKGMPPVGLLKITWAFFIWIWFTISISGRSFWGWKGRKGAWLIITGSLLLLLGLIANFYHIPF